MLILYLNYIVFIIILADLKTTYANALCLNYFKDKKNKFKNTLC